MSMWVNNLLVTLDYVPFVLFSLLYSEGVHRAVHLVSVSKGCSCGMIVKRFLLVR